MASFCTCSICMTFLYEFINEISRFGYSRLITNMKMDQYWYEEGSVVIKDGLVLIWRGISSYMRLISIVIAVNQYCYWCVGNLLNSISLLFCSFILWLHIGTIMAISAKAVIGTKLVPIHYCNDVSIAFLFTVEWCWLQNMVWLARQQIKWTRDDYSRRFASLSATIWRPHWKQRSAWCAVQPKAFHTSVCLLNIFWQRRSTHLYAYLLCSDKSSSKPQNLRLKNQTYWNDFCAIAMLYWKTTHIKWLCTIAMLYWKCKITLNVFKNTRGIHWIVIEEWKESQVRIIYILNRA